MNWKRVCAVGDVATNSLKKYTIDGVSIIVANVGDGFKAFPPLCPHMEEPLEESGVCDGQGKLTCIKHLWNWDLRTGAPQGETERALLMYDIKSDAGDDDDDFFKS
jgi:toluene monooxygenase system ferredoxin subunit